MHAENKTLAKENDSTTREQNFCNRLGVSQHARGFTMNETLGFFDRKR
jgi:hypothetical protein